MAEIDDLTATAMMASSTCLICSDNNSTNTKACLCPICSHCLYQWTTNKIKELFLKGDDTVRCPNLSCNNNYKILDILPLLRPNEAAEANSFMLKNYVQETHDIISCQNSSCQYFGFMTNTNCKSHIICEACHHRWKEKSMFTKLEKFIYYLNNLTIFIDEIKTEIYEAIFTVNCPSCGIPIRKAGGCDHMTCKRCGFEFCWICRFKYHGHSDLQCYANIKAKVLISGFILFHLGWLLNIYAIVWYAIVNLIKFTLKVAFFNFTFVILFMLMFPILCICKERESIAIDRKKFMGYTIAFAIMLMVSWWDICYIMNNYGKEFVSVISGEGIIISLIYMIDFLTQTWIKYVL